VLPAIDPSDPSTLTLPPIGTRKNKKDNMKYRALLESSPDAIVVVNQSGTIVLVNAQTERLFGYRRDELIGKAAEILVSQHFRGQHSNQHSRFLGVPSERPTVVGLELFGLRKDGSEFPAEIRLSPVDTKKGMLISSAIRDISGRRRTEEDLRRLASIVECSDDAIIGKTLEGIITSWNGGAERIYGYSATEAIGKPVSMLVPIDRPNEIPEILERLKRNEVVDHFETFRVRKDGTEFNIEITASPIRDAMERVVGASTIGRDISERKQHEKELYRLAALVESSDDAIIGKTLEGIITNWNSGAQRIYGYSAAEIVGKSISTFFSPDRYFEITELMEKIKQGEKVERADTIRVRQDGEKIHVALTLSPIKDSDDQVIGVSTVARDITESRQLEQMLRQAQKMEAMGQLAGGVAHDFNNLLGVILGYSELFLERLDLTDPQRKDIKEIQKAGERAALLTRQLLAFSRKQVLQPKVLDLNAVVAGAEKLLQWLIGENIELRVVLNPAIGRVKADSGQLEQVIMNLAVNSRDAMPAGGKLTIETSNVGIEERSAVQHITAHPGPHVLLAVTDTGCGMDANTKAHIFEPFFTTKEFGKGTGLGLATVYGIVKQSGGSIWVHTELGIDTTFKIYLPLVDPVPNEEPPTYTCEQVERRSHSILIVEDDAALLQVTFRSLEEVGYAILAARSPAEAIHLSENHMGPIHLMVTDVIMPGMSGAQLASHLSALRPEMKVLYVSGYTDDTIVLHGVLEAGLAFLQKPFLPKMLVRKVAEVLATTVLFADPSISEKVLTGSINHVAKKYDT
jgi:two-component system cell cycle sensor histidine kinase/response regulator CckA